MAVLLGAPADVCKYGERRRERASALTWIWQSYFYSEKSFIAIRGVSRRARVAFSHIQQQLSLSQRFSVLCVCMLRAYLYVFVILCTNVRTLFCLLRFSYLSLSNEIRAVCICGADIYAVRWVCSAKHTQSFNLLQFSSAPLHQATLSSIHESVWVRERAWLRNQHVVNFVPRN